MGFAEPCSVHSNEQGFESIIYYTSQLGDKKYANVPTQKVTNYIAVTHDNLEFMFVVFDCLFVFLAWHQLARPEKVFLKRLFNSLVTFVGLGNHRITCFFTRNMVSWSATTRQAISYVLSVSLARQIVSRCIQTRPTKTKNKQRTFLH